MQLRSVHLPLEDTVRQSDYRTIGERLSRAVGNLGAPLGSFHDLCDWEDKNDLFAHEDGCDDDRDVVIYSDDPLAAGLGLEPGGLCRPNDSSGMA